ncbi:hypothetical protein ANN_15608 [Periplaneta americana]|uniref:Uncharacterized protein n=1 Tax=Periplaneta americana TaxID=6978 RepID=A0ABQ8SGT9_PERAM|nr:hypothetical protein ANN_15608 [Periplaneta americana]
MDLRELVYDEGRKHRTSLNLVQSTQMKSIHLRGVRLHTGGRQARRCPGWWGDARRRSGVDEATRSCPPTSVSFGVEDRPSGPLAKSPRASISHCRTIGVIVEFNPVFITKYSVRGAKANEGPRLIIRFPRASAEMNRHPITRMEKRSSDGLTFTTMEERMDGRTDGWMDGRTNGWMDGWVDEYKNELMIK